MSRLTVFANFFIDNEERYMRMKDSFMSFSDIDAKKWVVNVRGSFAVKTICYLRDHLDSKLISFSLNSKNGWFYDSKEMLSVIDSDYVFFWLEDHISLVNSKLLDEIVQELIEKQISYMMYSFWFAGKLRERYQGVTLSAGINIDSFIHDKNNNKLIQKNNKEGVFLIPACSIFKRSLFEKIILSYNDEEKRWPKETPFDFEKKPEDEHWLPLLVGLPKQELFASIDDDHVHPGTSLISRGLYPNRMPRQSYASTRLSKKTQIFKSILSKFKKAFYSFGCKGPK